MWANLSSSRDSPGALIGQSPTATRPEKRVLVCGKYIKRAPLPFIRQGRDGEQYIERGGSHVASVLERMQGDGHQLLERMHLANSQPTND